MTARFKNVFAGFFAFLMSFALVFSVAFAAPMAAFADADKAVKNIVDTADVLSKDQYKSLEKHAQKLSSKYDVEVFVVYVDKMTESKVRDSGTAFYKQMESEIGDGEIDGAMLYISVGDRKMVTLTRGDAIEMFTDSRIDEAEDAVVSYLGSNDWAGAGEAFLTETDTTLAYYAQNGKAMPATDGRSVDYDYDDDDSLLWIIGCAVVVALIAAFATRSFLKNQLKSVAAGANANFYQTGEVTVTGSSDRFMGTTVSRTLIKKDDDSCSSTTSSSGGFGGSSGRSF